MHKPMEGVRILEVALWGFVPSAGAVLADWGADVIKVEHARTGDPQRGLRQMGSFKVEEGVNAAVEHPNRGKRSIGLDLSTSEGLDVLYRLVARADVFLTSFLPAARRKLKIDVDDIRARNPKIVYARGSALGSRGGEAEAGGYDMTAFWARGAIAASLTPPDMDGIISPPAPAYGDTIAGMNLAGGIAAALMARERSGEPSVVDVSLLSSGMWAMGMAIDLSLAGGQPWKPMPTGSNVAPTNPISGLYRTADGKHVSLVLLQPGRYWADFCHHIDRPDLVDDPRFSTAERLTENTAEATAILREVLGSRSLAEWSKRFATLRGPWAPVQDTLEVTQDAQARANDYIVPVGDHGYELVANPVQFDDQPPQLGPAPEFAEHTELVLLELGVDWEEIAALKDAGAIT